MSGPYRSPSPPPAERRYVRWRLWLARAWLSALCLGAGALLVWAASASSVVLVMLSALLAFGASAGVVALTGWALSVIVERRDER